MKYIKYLIFAVAGSVFVSCDSDKFLNPLPETVSVEEGFYESDEDVVQGIMGIYDAIQGVNVNTQTSYSLYNRGVQFEFLLTEHRTDNTRGATLEGSKADFHRYIIDANNVESEDYYASMYEVIFRANSLLNYVDAANEDNVAKYTAEIKFLRGYAYFNLVRLYGDVPLVTNVILSGDDAAYTRIPVAQVYEQIVLDFQEAIANLDNTYKSRASLAAAQGLLAKVYLSQATPDYASAQQLCEAIMGSGFALEANFSDVFSDELNSEIIFAIQYDLDNPTESQSFSAEFTSYVRQGREDGLNIVNDNLRSAFVAAGGNRGAQSYVTLGSGSHEVIKFLPEGSDITTNPAAPTYGDSPQDAGNDWIVLRYADVLLMHAEALMAGGASTSSGSAIDSYMETRVRAGFDAVADRPSALTKDNLLLERRVELAFENHRFFDLLRFGLADAILSAHATEMGYGEYSARALLLPIPGSEITLSKGVMTQNPGY